MAHPGGGQRRLGLGQVIAGARAGRQAAEEHGRDDAGRLHRALARQLDQAGVIDAVPDRLLELRVGRDLGDLRVVVGEQEEQVRRGAVDDLHAGHALRLGGGEVDRDLGLALEHVQLLHVGLDVADHDLAVLRLRAPVLRVGRQHHLRGVAVAGQRVRPASLGRPVERRLGLVGLGRVGSVGTARRLDLLRVDDGKRGVGQDRRDGGVWRRAGEDDGVRVPFLEVLVEHHVLAGHDGPSARCRIRFRRTVRRRSSPFHPCQEA